MGHNIVNINIFNNAAAAATPGNGTDVFSGIDTSALERIDTRLTDIFNTAGLNTAFEFQSTSQLSIWAGQNGAGCVLPPDQGDCCHPQGNLRTEDGKITTPGGYTIEATKQHEWIITGPDGKTTRIWGDPHVAEGDGGKWDFKRDSTFVLGDGTKINVKTAPWGDGKMTVTSELEIISGNDRVNVTGIDKGKGVVGSVTQDGYAHANCFGNNDVFVMGPESDDWALQGREITGSKNGGESFELGNQLAPGNTRPQVNNWAQPQQYLNELMGYLFGNGNGGGWNYNTSWSQNQFANNPYYDGHCCSGSRGGNYDGNYHREFMRDSFQLVSQMLGLMDRLFGMGGDFNTMRNRSIYA